MACRSANAHFVAIRELPSASNARTGGMRGADTRSARRGRCDITMWDSSDEDEDARIEAEVATLTEVVAGRLFVSGDRFSQTHLDTHGIAGVVTVARECAIQHSCPSLRLDVDDWEGEQLSDHFPRALAFIDAHSCVLVHCAAGASRSPTVALAWLMSRQRITLREAFDGLKAKRSIVQPNEVLFVCMCVCVRRLIRPVRASWSN